MMECDSCEGESVAKLTLSLLSTGSYVNNMLCASCLKKLTGREAIAFTGTLVSMLDRLTDGKISRLLPE